VLGPVKAGRVFASNRSTSETRSKLAPDIVKDDDSLDTYYTHFLYTSFKVAPRDKATKPLRKRIPMPHIDGSLGTRRMLTSGIGEQAVSAGASRSAERGRPTSVKGARTTRRPRRTFLNCRGCGHGVAALFARRTHNTCGWSHQGHVNLHQLRPKPSSRRSPSAGVGTTECFNPAASIASMQRRCARMSMISSAICYRWPAPGRGISPAGLRVAAPI
jgi:hypothetical protein